MFAGGNGLPDPSTRAKFVDGSPGVKEVGPTSTSRSGPEETSSTPTTTTGPIRRVQFVGQPPPHHAGLVAAYSFNEGTGDERRRRLRQREHRARSATATWTTQGKYGNALTFNGTSARVTVPDATVACS